MNRLRLVGAGALAAVSVAVVATEHRWNTTPDPTGGAPLRLDDGEDTVCVTDDGARVAVRVIAGGAGGDVVLPHCWLGSRQFWGPVAQRLAAAGHRVVVYDQRGHGASTVGTEGLTLSALALDLKAVLEHVDARDAVVAGHSMGGMAAQVFAIEHPDVLRQRVRGLVLAATSCESAGHLAILGRALEFFVGHPKIEPAYRLRYVAPLMVRFTVGRKVNLSYLNAITETLLSTPPEVRIKALRAIATLDLSASLAEVDVPTIVMVGTVDLLTPLAHARQIASSINGAQLKVLPGLGHMLPWEAPDEIVAAVRDLSTIDLTNTSAAFAATIDHA